MSGWALRMPARSIVADVIRSARIGRKRGELSRESEKVAVWTERMSASGRASRDEPALRSMCGECMPLQGGSGTVMRHVWSLWWGPSRVCQWIRGTNKGKGRASSAPSPEASRYFVPAPSGKMRGIQTLAAQHGTDLARTRTSVRLFQDPKPILRGELEPARLGDHLRNGGPSL